MKYPKIQTVYLRDPETNFKTLLEGQFAKPEFEYLASNEWVFTEKIDGTNIRVVWDGNSVGYYGRTDKAQIPLFLLDELCKLFPKNMFVETFPELPMIIYGEGYGAKIQKGGGNYIPDGVSFIAFDVLINGNWQERENVEDIAEQLGIYTVPIVGYGSLYQAVEMVRAGFQSTIGSQIAEGLVMRPLVELQNRLGERVVSKIKYKDFPH